MIYSVSDGKLMALTISHTGDVIKTENYSFIGKILLTFKIIIKNNFLRKFEVISEDQTILNTKKFEVYSLKNKYNRIMFGVLFTVWSFGALIEITQWNLKIIYISVYFSFHFIMTLDGINYDLHAPHM